MQQIPISLLTLLAGVLVTLISLWVGQHHGLLPEQASEQAIPVDNLFNTMVTIGTALFLVVQGTIVIFMWRYRKRKGDESDGVPLEGNLPLEIVWTAIPAIIVIGLGLYSTEVYQQIGGISSSPMIGHVHGGTQIAHHQPVGHAIGQAIAAPLPEQTPDVDPVSNLTDAPTETLIASADGSKQQTTYGLTGSGLVGIEKPAELVVNVTGLQFAWIFNYPDQGITTGELHVPIGKDVQVNLAAQDVIHSFWVPQFRMKQDAIPGQHTELRFKANRVGEYPVVCAELCGSYHGSMRTRVIVHTQDDFDHWLLDNQPAQEASTGTQTVLATANLQDLTDAEFLTPYAQELGVRPDLLSYAVPSHHASSNSL